MVFELFPLSAKDKDIAVVTATQPTAKMIRQMRVMDIEDLLRPPASLSAWSSGNLSDSSGFPIFRQGRAASLQSIFILSLIKLPISRYLK